MKVINKALVIFLLVVFLITIQQFKILSIGGVNPNLILIAFLTIIFYPGNRWPFLGTATLVLFLVFSTTMSFWLPELSVFLVLILLIKFTRKFLTGHAMPDFSVGLVFGTIIFQFFISIKNAFSLEIKTIFIEVLFNLILGLVGWLTIHRLSHNKLISNSKSYF